MRTRHCLAKLDSLEWKLTFSSLIFARKEPKRIPATGETDEMDHFFFSFSLFLSCSSAYREMWFYSMLNRGMKGKIRRRNRRDSPLASLGFSLAAWWRDTLRGKWRNARGQEILKKLRWKKERKEKRNKIKLYLEMMVMAVKTKEVTEVWRNDVSFLLISSSFFTFHYFSLRAFRIIFTKGFDRIKKQKL